jgi:hypothetical protein
MARMVEESDGPEPFGYVCESERVRRCAAFIKESADSFTTSQDATG